MRCRVRGLPPPTVHLVPSHAQPCPCLQWQWLRWRWQCWYWWSWWWWLCCLQSRLLTLSHLQWRLCRWQWWQSCWWRRYWITKGDGCSNFVNGSDDDDSIGWPIVNITRLKHRDLQWEATQKFRIHSRRWNTFCEETNLVFSTANCWVSPSETYIHIFSSCWHVQKLKLLFFLSLYYLLVFSPGDMVDTKLCELLVNPH